MKAERIKPHDPERRKAAKARVKEWFDKPEHTPKPEDEPVNETIPEEDE